MRCPFCSENRDRVVDSRESRDGAMIRRRRECVSCGRRFTSYEQIEDIPYMVVKQEAPRRLAQGL
jgi:transcriptional repressor NrdR